MSAPTIPDAAAFMAPGFWRRSLHHPSFAVGAALTLLLLAARRDVARLDTMVAL